MYEDSIPMIRVSAETKAGLEKLAETDGRTLTDYVRKKLNDLVKKKK